MSKLNKKDRILILGNTGMVGLSIQKKLNEKNYKNVLSVGRKDIDLTSQNNFKKFLKSNKFDCIFLCAAKVGGIYSNNRFPAEYIYQNLVIECNVIHQSYLSDVKKLLFLGSSCIYPKFSKQPIRENELFKGNLEPTNEPYAIAKIAGIKMCESYNRQYGLDYRSVMPTNLYGDNDKFDTLNSHVIPALIKKFYYAKKNNEKKIIIFGDGRAKRDFLHVDDMTDACIKIMELSKKKLLTIVDERCSHINIGSGEEITIRDLSKKIAKVIGYSGKIEFDKSKLNGTPRKKLNITKIKKVGWKRTIPINKGLKSAYEWFLNHAN
ncbi:MAG: GDP-L-fucose synthase [Alphaproteobacteria bacterium MarineAlpha5_Bin5]|nr:MAG: GDP-L-fucose synthase [Alphaproteobacteria bacterium MarineAlpha5_Bin5]|tara:strand:+ start:6103 stop:7068 length:966 start_codon:yes stop_codon:yes gene_type:complete